MWPALTSDNSQLSKPDPCPRAPAPDMAQFRGLWERLPPLAKERTQVTALFASADGRVREER